MKTKNSSSEKGIVALPIFIGLAFMAVALTVGIGLVQKNQNLQNRASSATTYLNVGQSDCFKTPCRPGLVCSKGVCVLSSASESGASLYQSASSKTKATCKSQSGSCKRYNILNVSGFNISSASKTRCPSGLVDIGQTSDCKGLAQTCCIPRPKVTPMPTLIPTPVTGSCNWCGASCVKTRPEMVCVALAPPANQVCTTASDGTCVVKSLGLVTKPTITPGTIKPTNTICAWCGAGCKEVRNDIDFSIQCPTVNIAVPVGGNVTQTCTRLVDGTCGIQTVPKITSVPIAPSLQYAY